jgi:hypothetical protein
MGGAGDVIGNLGRNLSAGGGVKRPRGSGVLRGRETAAGEEEKQVTPRIPFDENRCSQASVKVRALSLAFLDVF